MRVMLDWSRELDEQKAPYHWVLAHHNDDHDSVYEDDDICLLRVDYNIHSMDESALA
jgi:hypothetical protein